MREEDEWLADVIEAMLRDVMDRLPSERMNDEGERLSPVQGGYGLLVDWLDSVSGKDWLGDLKVSLVHPYGIVPQAGMTQVADMDFFFSSRRRRRSDRSESSTAWTSTTRTRAIRTPGGWARRRTPRTSW